MKKYILFVVCVCVLTVFGLSACSKSVSAPSNGQNADAAAESASDASQADAASEQDTKTLIPTPGPIF